MLWVSWLLSEDGNVSVSTGPVDDVVVGQTVSWDMYSKQGVYFVKSKSKVSSSNHLSYSINFHVTDSRFEYAFRIL